MKQRIRLMAAPPSIQPGGYVRKAYGDRTSPVTTWADLIVEPRGKGWHVFVSWSCPEQRTDTGTDVNRFGDAAAILAPASADAPMMTMGNETAPVDGWLWRADHPEGLRVSARGFGSTQRLAMPDGATVGGIWSDGHWGVGFDLPAWQSLQRTRLIGVAIWQGAAAERAGLKSVTTNWLEVP
jgi:DMSO reductase family type II enzyme heme b subunit